MIERPVYTEDFKFQDEDTQLITSYLVENTNTTFYPALRSNIIKTSRTWNDLFIPLTDFPLLKVYKNTEVPFSFISKPLSTQFTISYILAFTQPPKQGDVSTFVAKELVRNLVNGSLESPALWQLDYNYPINVEYDTTIDPKNQIKKYTNIICNIFTRQ